MRSAGMGLAPVVIYAGHLFHGSATLLPALVLFACLLAVLLLTLASDRARRDLDRLAPSWLLIGLFGAVVCAALFTLGPGFPGGSHPVWIWSGGTPSITLNRSATILEILKLGGLAASFLIGCVYGARIETARRLYAGILLLGAVYAGISLAIFLSRGSLSLGAIRLAGGFESANVAGSVFGVLVVMATAWGLRTWSRARGRTALERGVETAPGVALGLLFLGCLLLTASRGALGATGLALGLFAVMVAVGQPHLRRPLFVMSGMAVLGVVVVLLQGDSLLVDRVERLDAGGASRFDLLAPHWRAFLDAPLFGSGLGTFPEVNNLIMTPETASTLSATVVLHNVYLQWLEEAGVVGAAPMFLLILVILGTTAWRAFASRRNRTLVLGLLSASVLVLVHATVDVSLNTPSFCAFWSLLLGLGFALSQAAGFVEIGGGPVDDETGELRHGPLP